MTFIIDLTDSDNKRRTVEIQSSYDIVTDPFGHTLAAHILSKRGIEVERIHDIKEKA